MATLHFGTHEFSAGMVIFDKDGTLIDFAGLWAHYTINAVEALLAAIEADGGRDGTRHDAVAIESLSGDLYTMLGYDPTADRFDPQSPVVTAPLATLNTLAAGVLYRHGWGWLNAELLVQKSFGQMLNAPLPREMVRATAPLPPLFDALISAGIPIAVVTSDDRAPTLAALEWLGVAHQVAFVACADDGYPYKPAPEAVWAACEATGVEPSRAVMVGDSTTDMLMGQRAGVGLRVAVLTGMMGSDVLAPLADVVLNSIAEIHVPG